MERLRTTLSGVLLASVLLLLPAAAGDPPATSYYPPPATSYPPPAQHHRELLGDRYRQGGIQQVGPNQWRVGLPPPPRVERKPAYGVPVPNGYVYFYSRSR